MGSLNRFAPPGVQPSIAHAPLGQGTFSLQSGSKAMQSVVEVGGDRFQSRWATKLLSAPGALRGLLQKISRELTSESLEATVSRAIDQAFAEFAREMRGD